MLVGGIIDPLGIKQYLRRFKKIYHRGRGERGVFQMIFEHPVNMLFYAPL